MYPEEFKYSRDHEWAEIEGQTVRIGITNYAQEQLGDIVFIELPKIGEVFKQNDVFGTVESVKAVSELYSPISGEVVQINDSLENEPELVNDDPHGEGWMIVIKMTDNSDLENLLDAEEYETHIEEESADDDFGDDDGDFDGGDEDYDNFSEDEDDDY